MIWGLMESLLHFFLLQLGMIFIVCLCGYENFLAMGVFHAF